jgi:hypothetical protein
MEAATLEYAAAGAEALSREQPERFYNRNAPALRAYIRRGVGRRGLGRRPAARSLRADAQRTAFTRNTANATNLITDYHRAQYR